ncbi:hypothetical protein ADM98_08515 [Exiguobacterium sp. BMC-KP]|uniref:hypothetical protein n=1 Tax=Exiguobacterium sp. BMC-KP TaxID=1684312 RepID=UPI0006AA32ED|nr:hypothetical protein [Exiguobacterium sp. BMC-KP]KOP28956.1 hypothetical protein ADM98_08515 [Exiguobacterium sp. BMC-KP]
MENVVNGSSSENQNLNGKVGVFHMSNWDLSKKVNSFYIEEVLSNVSQILIVPVGSLNFERTVAFGNGNSPFPKGLHEGIPNEILENVSGNINTNDDRFYGCKNRKTNRNEKCYLKLTKDTLIVFQSKGKVVGLANIRDKFVSETLAEWAWDDGEYKFIYTLENYVSTDLPIIDLTASIYSKGSVVQNMRRIWKKEQVTKVLEYLSRNLNGK